MERTCGESAGPGSLGATGRVRALIGCRSVVAIFPNARRVRWGATSSGSVAAVASAVFVVCFLGLVC